MLKALLRGQPTPWPTPFQTTRWRARPALLAALAAVGLLAAARPARAQVSQYTFGQTTGTYTPITGGVVAGTATAGSNFSLDDNNFSLAAGTIPFNFNFGGTNYTGLIINSNGYVTFGATAPSVSGYTPLSSATGYAGAAAAVGQDLVGDATTGSLGEIRYQTVGSAPNRSFVIQYTNFKRYVSAIQVDNLNFQIRLNETSNTVNFVYNMPTVAATATGLPQVGLRGASNTVYVNRTTTTNWSASTPGTTNTATMTLSSTVKPVSGLTYTFTPPVPCTAPPTAGTAAASVSNGCGTISSTTLSLTGSATGSGLTYQWQQSATGAAGSFTNVSGTGTNATYTASSLTSTTYFQAIVTCSGQSATSAPVQVTVNPTAVPYATLPVTQGFESWLSRCNNQEVPGPNWRNTPASGDNSWRRNDQGHSTSGWRYINDEPAPYQISSSQGSYSARFHSYGTTSGGTGSLDLFVDLSAAGTKTLTFDYINPTGTDKLDVLLSSDGGATFSTTPLLTLGTASAFGGQSVTFSGTSATSVVRLQATSDFGNDDIGIDNLRLQVTPSCPGVAFSPTTNISSTSATINFAAVPGASSYTVAYAPGGGSQTVTSAGAVTLTGLLPYTVYTVTVTTNCGGGQSGTATTSFRTAIGNNECSGAVALTVGQPGDACSAVTYTTSGATASTVTSSCTAIADGDVWFSFVAGGPRHTITVVPTFDFDAVIELRSGSCPGTSVSCQNASSSGGGAGTEALIATGLTPGQTYLVRVYSAVAGAGSGNFDICITTPPNVPCAQVTNALVTNTGSTTTASTGTLTFDAAAGATSYYLTLTPTAGGNTSTATVAGSPVNLTGLTPNTSYTIAITTNCSNGGVSNPVTVVFTSQAPPTPPANDDCAGATPITSIGVGTCGTAVAGTNVGATASPTAGTPAPGCASYAGGDVWYSLTVPANGIVQVATGQGSGTSLSDTGLALYSGSCGALTLIGCNDDTNVDAFSQVRATGLPPGSTIYARVWAYNNAATGTFTICAQTDAPCAPPTALAAGSLTSTSASISFTAGNGNTSYTVTYTPQGGSATTVSPAPTASPVALTGLTPNTQYTVSIVGNCAGSTTSAAATTTFTTLAPPPANDECASATPITSIGVGTCGTAVAGTNVGATASPTAGTPAPGCASYAGGDVWYSLTVPANGIVQVATGQGSGTSLSDTGLALYSGSCGALTLIGCDDDSGPNAFSLIRATGLTPNSTIYVRVWEYSNDETGTFTICAQTDAPNLTVSSSQNLAGGTYNNVTITGTGALYLSGNLVVNGALVVQTGGVLGTSSPGGCAIISGPGSFTLQDGAALGICSPDGLSSSGATGSVQVTGTRSFNPGATYIYNSQTTAQVTGPGLPTQVRNLTTGSQALTLSQALAVKEELTLNNGNLNTNGQPLTLLSDATGTALVKNFGGEVLGTATVQRYIDPSLNAGAGYRHYAAPISNTTVADLATGGFTPTVNLNYNSSSAPNLVTPFPTVFGYDESRVLTSPATTYSAFDKGWFSPSALSSPMEVGRGYTVNIPASQKVDFSGTLVNGPVNRSLTRAGGAQGGLHLVGNPYPSPLDWTQMTLPAGLDNAMYVYQSTGQYTGAYRSYVNGFGNPLISSGQGFFVRLSAGASSAQLSFTNAARVLSYSTQQSFNRGAETRPVVQLTLRSAGSALADETYVYFEAGATAGVDSRYDALKLQHNSGGMPSVYALAAGTELSINGLPALTSNTVVPLGVNVPAVGTYTFQTAQLLNLSTAVVYLHDAVTGQDIDLHQQPTYSFTAASTALPGRFELRFTPQRPTASTPSLTAASVTLFPNPAHQHVTVLVPAVPTAKQVRATLLNSLGQVVATQTVALPAAGARLTFEVAPLAAGVYTVRLQAGDATVAKRLVVE
ncbi:T9SS type A sorting domain-containing protein [Hymenobacter gummosus]|uniref:T9SS type A sorting domain-containing protein n=1 Tax=Hymenobacter gummosus TaxID=1776032 RepID=A0A431U2J6_9BACT|nr:fibronectin type III domain-containing protein [Hymenobacter gummosus]RTQ49590.1 T9SS type A sorting domain-containing protein [Hymenobacter gummosus]